MSCELEPKLKPAMNKDFFNEKISESEILQIALFTLHYPYLCQIDPLVAMDSQILSGSMDCTEEYSSS